MTKSDLIDSVAEKTELTKKVSAATIEAMFEAIGDALVKGEKVQLVGFGSFEVKKREARKGRNPQTGAVIKIASRNVPLFKAGKALKEAVSK